VLDGPWGLKAKHATPGVDGTTGKGERKRNGTKEKWGTREQ
jgi:hypothetical protein